MVELLGWSTPLYAFLTKLEEQQTTVLDDKRGFADLYTEWLSDEYNVRTAYTAAEAREKFATRGVQSDG